MNATPKSLAEMTVSELEALKLAVSDANAKQIRLGRPHEELEAFWHAIDDELDRRGA